MKELKFVLTTPHGSQIEISKKENSEIIFLRHKGARQKITQVFNDVDELSEHLKKHVFGPVFEILA